MVCWLRDCEPVASQVPEEAVPLMEDGRWSRPEERPEDKLYSSKKTLVTSYSEAPPLNHPLIYELFND